jgi:hypothetical protein
VQLLTWVPQWRNRVRMSSIIVLFLIVFGMEVSGAHMLRAAGGSANFSLQPDMLNSNNLLSQSYFIFNAAPATVVAGHVRVTNTGTARGTVSIYPVDATTGSAGGIVYLAADSHFHDVGAWVALAKLSLTLNAGESKDVSFGLFVPRGASPGQHIGGIVAENVSLQNASPSSGHGNITINLHLKKLYALPIVVNVPGHITEHLATAGAIFDTHSPYQRVLIDLKNTGNTILYPVGSAVISNSRGIIVQSTQLTISAFLPHTSIEYPLNIAKRSLLVGQYSVRFTVNYGKQTRGILTTIFTFSIHSPGRSLSTLASQALVSGPADFLRSLALWQYALVGVALLLVGSALLFWVQKVYGMVVNGRRKGESRRA